MFSRYTLRMVKHHAKHVGVTQQKILLLLFGGLALGLSGSPKQYFRVAKAVGKEWQSIEHRQLQRSLKMLYESRLIEAIEHRDRTTELVLSTEGKRTALRYNLENLHIKKPAHWDKKWRIVMFDVPERLKKLRQTLHFHLKELEFYQYQKSVFVHPYECSKEIEFILEFYGARKYVRFVEATNLDNELHLKTLFRP
ncbi:MAG: hypothetical protein A3D65_03970 [Candidatus Lloydbacteria bacterium RIFCSPHIGHO2_02_FULL_50_13]|uniref:Transcriptional repressor PaaX-like central Cas2-like domain-containing protein n=1 Tax=Candidatus Lloydbacteria bacterium RIFCSPHIGHO2_02_FULL_50_13 TaxID=1798661 RepID=A0A1G2D9B4_9BACT|nr:MAG: hypothetical protein A3D65_03970 [Candidatus Lloydbacteria bacterium RIFCSPHIGHO2_02_FULL_50_13]